MNKSCHTAYLKTLTKIYCPRDGCQLQSFDCCKHCSHRFNAKDVACYNRGKLYYEREEHAQALQQLEQIKGCGFHNIEYSKYKCLAALGRHTRANKCLVRACLKSFAPALKTLARLQHLPPEQEYLISQALVKHKSAAWGELGIHLAEHGTSYKDHKLVSSRLKRFIKQGDKVAALAATRMTAILSRDFNCTRPRPSPN